MEMGINEYSAYDVINTLDKEHLATIIKVLGEEKDGRLIANKIDKYRRKKPIKTSQELASIINDAKKNYNKYKKNPATKTFQAIRIFVNKELTELILGLIEAAKLLSNGGVLIVVSFHSLEDRIVKNFFNLYSNLRKNPSRYLPIKVSKSSLFKQISKKPLVANVKEVNENIRSRSAKLRYAIRNNNSFFYPDEFKKKFVKENGDLVGYVLSVRDYETLAINMAELKRNIEQQKQIIVYYEKAVTPEVKKKENKNNYLYEYTHCDIPQGLLGFSALSSPIIFKTHEFLK